jgi:ribosomal protein L22
MRVPSLGNFWREFWNKRQFPKNALNNFIKINELKKPQEKPKLPLQSFWLQSSNFKCSAQKLSLLANQITRMKLIDAINQMKFSPKKASRKVFGILMKMKTHIDFQSTLSPHEYYVRQATVGRGKYQREIDIKAKGRFGIISHPNSFIRIELAQWIPKEDLIKQLRKVIAKSKKSKFSENCKVAAKINY